jgi:hypothetical protein
MEHDKSTEGVNDKVKSSTMDGIHGLPIHLIVEIEVIDVILVDEESNVATDCISVNRLELA